MHPGVAGREARSTRWVRVREGRPGLPVCSLGSERTHKRGRWNEGEDGVGPESDRRTERQTSTEGTSKKRSSLRITAFDA